MYAISFNIVNEMCSLGDLLVIIQRNICTKNIVKTLLLKFKKITLAFLSEWLNSVKWDKYYECFKMEKNIFEYYEKFDKN